MKMIWREDPKKRNFTVAFQIDMDEIVTCDTLRPLDFAIFSALSRSSEISGKIAALELIAMRLEESLKNKRSHKLCPIHGNGKMSNNIKPGDGERKG